MSAGDSGTERSAMAASRQTHAIKPLVAGGRGNGVKILPGWPAGEGGGRCRAVEARGGGRGGCGAGRGGAAGGGGVTTGGPGGAGGGARQQETRSFATTRRDLLSLADWLRSWGVTKVGMEATSDYVRREGA